MVPLTFMMRNFDFSRLIRTAVGPISPLPTDRASLQSSSHRFGDDGIAGDVCLFVHIQYTLTLGSIETNRRYRRRRRRRHCRLCRRGIERRGGRFFDRPVRPAAEAR